LGRCSFFLPEAIHSKDLEIPFEQPVVKKAEAKPKDFKNLRREIPINISYAQPLHNNKYFNMILHI